MTSLFFPRRCSDRLAKTSHLWNPGLFQTKTYFPDLSSRLQKSNMMVHSRNHLKLNRSSTGTLRMQKPRIEFFPPLTKRLIKSTIVSKHRTNISCLWTKSSEICILIFKQGLPNLMLIYTDISIKVIMVQNSIARKKKSGNSKLN